MTARHSMTPEEFREALEWLDISAKSFANLIGANERTIRRMCEDGGDGPSPTIETLVCLIIATGWGGDETFSRAKAVREDLANRVRGRKIAGHRASTIIADDPEG